MIDWTKFKSQRYKLSPTSTPQLSNPLEWHWRSTIMSVIRDDFPFGQTITGLSTRPHTEEHVNSFYYS
jgi:hypothetical protein